MKRCLLIAYSGEKGMSFHYYKLTILLHLVVFHLLKSILASFWDLFSTSQRKSSLHRHLSLVSIIMICTMVCDRRTAVCVGLIPDDCKHKRQMFPFKFEAIADKLPQILCEVRGKRSALTSSLIAHVSRQTLVCR